MLMSHKRRRWLQFNLRTLLALTTLAAGGSAYVGAQVRAYYLEQETIAQLQAPVTGKPIWLEAT